MLKLEAIEAIIRNEWTKTKFQLAKEELHDEICRTIEMKVSSDTTLVMFNTRIPNHDNAFYYGFYLNRGGKVDYSNICLYSYEEYLSREMIQEVLNYLLKEVA